MDFDVSHRVLFLLFLINFFFSRELVPIIWASGLCICIYYGTLDLAVFEPLAPLITLLIYVIELLCV